MRVRILKTTVAAGQVVRVGSYVDLPDSDARALVQLGKAATVATPEPAQPAPEPAQRKRGRHAGD